MLFTITVKDTDPTRAAALAGAMADQFAVIVPTLGVNAGPSAMGAGPRPEEPTPTPGQPSEAPGSPQPTAKAPVARARVVEPPRVPDHAVTPVPVRNVAMGLVAGVLLGIAVALTREASDRTVRTREKLEQLSGLPTLAELPGKRGSALRFGADITLDDAVRGLVARLRRAM
jgi:hypothetical protein